MAEQHRTSSALCPDRTHLLLSYRRESYPEYKQTILTATTNGGAPSPILPNIPEDGPFSLSCSQGLISMHPRKAKANTYVHNTNTRETLSVPFNIDAFKDYVSVRNYIGFEPVSNQYKLMILGTWHKHANRKHCEIITLLGAKNWRQVVINGTPPIGNGASTCLNGALHWMAFDGQRVVVFDLESEKFRTILGPKRIQGHRVRFELCQVGGCLALVESGTYRPEASFELWTLKNYSNDVWVKESVNFSVPHDFLSTADIGRYLRIVGGINEDEIVISLLGFNPKVFAYNMKTKEVRKINVRGEHDTDR